MKIKKLVIPPRKKGRKLGYPDMFHAMNSLNGGESLSIRVSPVDLNNVRTSAYRYATRSGYKISTAIADNTLYITRKAS